MFGNLVIDRVMGVIGCAIIVIQGYLHPEFKVFFVSPNGVP